MELNNEFEVAVPVERAWAVLTDLERIAPCLPGAQLREVEGDEYRGAVKIKVGPITTSYDGTIRITEHDETAHRAVMKAEGRETRGQGNVAATITATMSPSGVGTKVVVATDLTISGKVAQFGRGVLADVSAKLLDQFVANLESTVLFAQDPTIAEGDSTPDESRFDDESPSTSRDKDSVDEDGSTGAVRHIDAEPAEPVDLIDIAGGSVARRFLKPVLIAAVGAAVLMRLVRRRRR